ncbi:MAG TPA: ABC transporter ATP-binding protein [Candidatus Sulfotelmatobacter sp.]|nr:ABC transporter ATP-binding protein [Candidatus Sulfotelmatobacter sp.]
MHWHLASFASITAGSLLALASPLLLKWLIDSIIPQKRIGLLVVAVLLIFLGHEGRVALTSIGSYLMLSASQKMGLTLRVDLLEHLDTLSADYYDRTPVGAVMYPLKEPIDEIAYFGSDLLPAILRLLLTTSFTVAAMVALSPMLTVAIIPLIPIFLVTRQWFRTKLTTAADTAQDDQLRWSNFLEEHLSSVMPIQLLGQEKRQERKAFQLLVRSVRSQLHLYRTAAWFTISSSFAIVLAISAVIGYGGRSVLAGTLSIGSLVAFYGFVTQLFDPLSGASELYARAQKTLASIRRVQAVLSLKSSVTNPPAPLLISKQHSAEIEFAGVVFGYSSNKDLLHVPTLRISAGDHIAIAGENGAGKSTLAKLMARLYDPISGSIRLGGEDLRNVHLKNLRQVISYLPRDPVLFDGTIASNLLFVRPSASEREIEEAMQLVGLSPLIAALPNSFRQRIGPDGCQLSGGERQRLALARAVLQKPQVVILDEATSCLDPASELKILQHLRDYLNLSTFVVISHRLSTFSKFGRVLLLSHGHIVSDADSHLFLTTQLFPSPPSMISTE